MVPNRWFRDVGIGRINGKTWVDRMTTTATKTEELTRADLQELLLRDEEIAVRSAGDLLAVDTVADLLVSVSF